MTIVGEPRAHADAPSSSAWSAASRKQQRNDQAETVWDLIEKQAQVVPGRTAIIDGVVEIEYRLLRKRATEIAGELLARGVEPGALVGICMSRTWELVAAMVGVLRAGCAYVPLDPAYPRERVRYMLEHAGVAATIVDGEPMAELCQGVPELVRLEQIGRWPPPPAERWCVCSRASCSWSRAHRGSNTCCRETTPTTCTRYPKNR